MNCYVLLHRGWRGALACVDRPRGRVATFRTFRVRRGQKLLLVNCRHWWLVPLVDGHWRGACCAFGQGQAGQTGTLPSPAPDAVPAGPAR